MGGVWTFVLSSLVPADTDAVWRRVITPEGINDEMRPWMTMSFPQDSDVHSIDAVRVGEPLGRARLRLFGVLPFDHDDLVITELEPGRRFLEESTMASMRRWVHERTVVPGPGGTTTITDRVAFEPRALLRWAGPVLRPVVAAFFAHRQRRLVRRFGGR
jgi:ligand-binding SRPBCC domain-containing protein